MLTLVRLYHFTFYTFEASQMKSISVFIGLIMFDVDLLFSTIGYGTPHFFIISLASLSLCLASCVNKRCVTSNNHRNVYKRRTGSRLRICVLLAKKNDIKPIIITAMPNSMARAVIKCSDEGSLSFV